MYQTITSLLRNYDSFIAGEIRDRFLKHADLIRLIEPLRNHPEFELREAGTSVQGRSINLIKCGNGPSRILMWSQMHGDEATATMALADLFNFLRKDQFSPVRNTILQNCTLYILPMVNPDGAEVFTRRNAMDIDINRDFLAQQTPEGRLLRALRDEINPHFGFNLHDQNTLWSAGKTGNPATISLLAPAFDEQLSIDPVRETAMLIIAEMNAALQKIIPDHIGRWYDEYEPRAFGDNFQAAGTSTILIESGGAKNDPEKQEIRKLVFAAIISGLLSVSRGTFLSEKIENYFLIPENRKNHFHILLKNCRMEINKIEYKADIGLIAEESLNDDLRSVSYNYIIGDAGDLSANYGYSEIDCSDYKLIPVKPLKLEKAASLILMDGVDVLLEIENGVLTIYLTRYFEKGYDSLSLRFSV